jgi:ribosomal protein S18 acetylase RimI-like enzyme
MEFRKVQRQDISQTNHLFIACLTELLSRENISEEGLLENEVGRLQKAVLESFENPGTPFFVAEKDGLVAGTIALYPPSSMIASAIDIIQGSLEVACVYVHPDFQRQGIGLFMFRQILEELRRMGHRLYILDAGFPSSQQYWKMLLGEPSIVLENYWGAGKHHFIWKREI